ncbi:N-acetylglucosamine-6-phosphate deacetylase [Jatrophihabitans telluris]|uniref:N-acetylglucosamine-6-phosphate deacetylase n=1 Tax=Jatrophihabitans telluris TaxID=2038343 RepID=A0ABY4R318_9ACTN|nr:N-acetylglucosamine-6-phosphate deacetylase [Jatrophihabitans telluris]UQX89424.1 N-acetylglucosamine-6-phosphate deacetylase [Jatrophihabitans telluris]
MNDIVLTGARVVTPEGELATGQVRVVDGRIAEVGSSSPDGGQLAAAAPSIAALAPSSGAVEVVRLHDGWIVPGFIDLHVHGGGGFDVTRGPQDMASAVAFHRAHGTTRTLVSLMAQPVEALTEQLQWVSALTADGTVGGAHLEGPFLNSTRCGAQRPENLIAPDPLVLRKLLEAGQGSVATMTVAPELPGAIELIGELVASGVRAAVGHTDASYDQAMAGFEAGASLATHLFNAMGSFSHREPGPAVAALDSGAYLEMINDGVHVHNALTRLVAGSAGDRLAFITDAISATGVGDGEYSLGDQRVLVRQGQARLPELHSLAGSTLTMDEAFRRAVLTLGMSVGQAVSATSSVPAAVLGLSGRCGAIAVGLDADLVVLDENFALRRVMIGGRWL